MDHIPVAGPWITQKEIDYVTDAVTNAWHSNHNMYHVYFESAFAVYIGRKYAITLPSCTSALHLSLASLGLDPDCQLLTLVLRLFLRTLIQNHGVCRPNHLKKTSRLRQERLL